MNAATTGILADVLLLTWIALVVGLVTYAIVRRANPLLRWHEHGNVWTSPLRFEDLMVVFVLAGYYTLQVVAAIHLQSKGGDAAGGVDAEGGNKAQVIALNIVITLMVTGALLFFLTHLRRIELSEIFGLRRMGLPRVLLWTVVAMVVVFPVIWLCMYVTWEFGLRDVFGGEVKEQPVVELFRQSADDPMTRILIVASACVVAPIAEEVIFRGFIYATLKRYSERFFAAVVTSGLFAVVHLSVPALGPLWVLAMFLTLAYELTGCLWVCILMHAIFNAGHTVVLVLQTG